MNYRMIARILGYILLAEAVLLVLPLVVALYYGESIDGFLVAMAACAAAGGLLFAVPQRSRVFYAREGFFVVSFGWALLSVFGCLPFYVDGCIPSFIDCLFETISGFTATGSTILTQVEALPKGMLFWRSFTHWIGGMGVLVFIMAVLPLSNEHSMYVMRAEVSGPTVGKLVPRARNTALWLYAIYFALTVAEVVFLRAGGMPLFDSVTHAFSTAGTGGFSIKNAGIASYGSDYITMVVGVFMLIFGVNFNVYFLLLMRHARHAFKNRELHVYLGLIVVSVPLVAVSILPQYASGWEAFRDAFFQVGALVSSTGFFNVDYDLWPAFTRVLLLFLMFVGACAGSTGGGFKVARLVMLLKKTVRDLKQILNPRSVSAVKIEGKRVEEETLSGVSTFFTVYVCLAVVSVLLLSLNGLSFEANFTVTISTLSNMGPAFAELGPTENMALLPTWSKLWLSFLMLLGRLEIFPLLLCFTPAMYRRSKA